MTTSLVMGAFTLLTSPQEVSLIEKALGDIPLDVKLYKMLKCVNNGRWSESLMNGEIKYLLKHGYIEEVPDGIRLTSDYGQFLFDWAEAVIGAARVVEMPCNRKFRAQSAG